MTFLEFALTDTPENRSRREKDAASAKLTPVSVDRENQTAVFQGSSGRYVTSLSSCPCGNFMHTRKPCKHMYRLAYELYVYDLSGVKSDKTAIPSQGPTTAQRAKATDYCISVINRSGEQAAKELQNLFVYQNAKATKGHPYPCQDCSILRPFFDAGMLAFVDAPEEILSAFGKKATVNAFMEAGGAFPSNVHKTISARFDWCLQNAAAVQSIACPSWSAIIPTGNLEIAKTKVYQFLNQLFPREVILYF